MSTMIHEKEAAIYIGMSRSFLRQDRMNGTIKGRTPGPNYYKIGKRVCYNLEDLDQWLAGHKVIRPSKDLFSSSQ